jgi:hypothetical protein
MWSQSPSSSSLKINDVKWDSLEIHDVGKATTISTWLLENYRCDYEYAYML